MGIRGTAAWAALVLCALVAPREAQAKSKKADTPKRVAAALKVGITKGDDVSLAFERAAALKDKFTAKEMKPVLKELGRAFKQDKKGLQLLALKTYVTLNVAGTYPHIAKLLKLPAKVVGIETRTVRIRAIKAAGTMHEEAALPDLENLLGHPDIAFSRTAAQALASYTVLPDDKRAKLVTRLLKRLAQLEKQAKDRKPAVAKAATTLITVLNPTIEKLTGKQGATTAAAWKKLLAAS